MNTTITPAQAENALEAIEKFNLKGVATSKAAYALAKNALQFNNVVKAFNAARHAIRKELFPDGEKFDPQSEKAGEFAARVQPLVDKEHEVNIHKLKLSQLMVVWNDAPITLLAAIDFMVIDDLEIDDVASAE